MFRVKKNDTVLVISGKDKNKQGAVLEILPSKNKVKVKGIAIKTKHLKGKVQGQASGIFKQESFIHISNVLPFCNTCKKGSRVNFVVSESGLKERVCNRCKKAF